MKLKTPAVKKIMLHYGLTLEAVSHRANCTMVETYKALHLVHVSWCPLILVASVRNAVENELRERGWNGQNEDLWLEYDTSLKKLLRYPGKARKLRAAYSVSR